MKIAALLATLSPERPVLIAGPTASGKSALAVEIVAAQGGVIVNADAIQVFTNWRVLTARPSVTEEAAHPHALYGHVSGSAPYSVGHWLRDLEPILQRGERPVIVGGTGLYFSALTEGLAQIPATPAETRAEADALPLADLIAGLDRVSASKIDLNNRARVQRAWEVQRATGRGIALWQAETPPPRLGLDMVQPLVVEAGVDWLNARIETRFDQMLRQGALEEARENLSSWSPAHLSAKAIGAPELIAHLQGQLTLDEAQHRATVATRQFAKRQRTWFRARMQGWKKWHPDD
ncbi:MAG TPA: tRNA (adenosine(37)-N6)-dimethylallyltransferase MiaA [Rhodobacteraceae bacterium]|jgi:tRNA dimethylallyltransferase|nr:tRNA (adenosine(37)-N6)-dimethylallyltransferase MiaA [Paracoccaceae bacterium]HBV55180.1 tRNA (adenosine(37)-N6)-dimethylallyltransferase MiaA [Paracoccaceae bacterium]